LEPLSVLLIRWQDSFEKDEKPERERDIEMGNRNPKDNSDYGLKDFFEQVWSSVYNESTSADLKVLSNLLFAVL
jgi:hypothetical protein